MWAQRSSPELSSEPAQFFYIRGGSHKGDSHNGGGGARLQYSVNIVYLP